MFSLWKNIVFFSCFRAFRRIGFPLGSVVSIGLVVVGIMMSKNIIVVNKVIGNTYGVIIMIAIIFFLKF